jgi:hypothetical protein
MTIELWKNIKNYENIYQVSSYGKIRRITKKYKRAETMKLSLNTSKYLRVSLWKNGKRKFYLVHRLVAEAFIPNIYPEKIFIHHKDHNRKNNCVENLEWVTSQTNTDHTYHFSIEQIIDHTINTIFSILKTKKPNNITCSAIRSTLVTPLA